MPKQRYVVIRDDDTNALTPVDCLETLYRPFLERQMPVNLATIPEVRTDARTPEGEVEGFLFARNGVQEPVMALGANKTLCHYLKSNAGFELVQHGLHHDFFEFDRTGREEIEARLERGIRRFEEAGFTPPVTFVAPHDKISRASYSVLARRFGIISTGWFEWRRLPRPWLPRYFFKKISKRPHWKVGRTLLLSHPGCILSYHRKQDEILPRIQQAIDSNDLTVLVTHWWEYFRQGRADETFIQVLHETAAYLHSRKDLKVIRFRDVPRLASV